MWRHVGSWVLGGAFLMVGAVVYLLHTVGWPPGFWWKDSFQSLAWPMAVCEGDEAWIFLGQIRNRHYRYLDETFRGRWVGVRTKAGRVVEMKRMPRPPAGSWGCEAMLLTADSLYSVGDGAWTRYDRCSFEPLPAPTLPPGREVLCATLCAPPPPAVPNVLGEMLSRDPVARWEDLDPELPPMRLHVRVTRRGVSGMGDRGWGLEARDASTAGSWRTVAAFRCPRDGVCNPTEFEAGARRFVACIHTFGTDGELVIHELREGRFEVVDRVSPVDLLEGSLSDASRD